MEKAGADSGKLLEFYTSEIAGRVVAAFDKAIAQPSLLKGDPDRVKTLFDWALKVPGGSFFSLCGGKKFADLAAERKLAKGLAD
jgi:hypothetical protein